MRMDSVILTEFLTLMDDKPHLSFFTHNFLDSSIVMIDSTGVPRSFAQDCTSQ